MSLAKMIELLSSQDPKLKAQISVVGARTKGKCLGPNFGIMLYILVVDNPALS